MKLAHMHLTKTKKSYLLQKRQSIESIYIERGAFILIIYGLKIDDSYCHSFVPFFLSCFVAKTMRHHTTFYMTLHILIEFMTMLTISTV